MRMIRLMLVAALAAFTVTACGGGKKTTTTAPAAEKSLYDRLGGKDAINTVVGMMLANVVADDRIKARFANSDACSTASQAGRPNLRSHWRSLQVRRQRHENFAHWHEGHRGRIWRIG